MGSRFDLNSLLSLQTQYAIDLSHIPDSDNRAKSYIKKLNTNLNSLNDRLNESEISSDTLILNQNKINDILTTENQRLLDKKQNVDSALIGQKRLLKINDSYRKKQAAYIKVTIVVIVALLLIVALQFLSKNVTSIPEVVYYLLFIILISGTIIYITLLLYNISIRDPINFDQLNLARPNVPILTPSGADITSTPKPTGSSLMTQCSNNGVTECVGSSCCLPGTSYINGTCQISPYNTIDADADVDADDSTPTPYNTASPTKF